MRKYFKLAILIVAFSFVGQWAWTGTVSPPVTIWSDFSAVSNIDGNGYDLTIADIFCADDQTSCLISGQGSSGGVNLRFSSSGPGMEMQSDRVNLIGGPLDFQQNNANNIDTASVGVLSADTHVEYEDGTTQTTSYRSQSNLPLTEIPAGDTASLRFTVPSEKTMNIIRLGIQSDTGASLSNLEVDIDTDNDDVTTIETTSATSTTSASTVPGGSNVIIRMDNNRADTRSASAFVEYRYE